MWSVAWPCPAWGQVLLALREHPVAAAATHGFGFLNVQVPSEKDLSGCGAHLDRLKIAHTPVISGASGRLVGFHDLDGHELSFYARTTTDGVRDDAVRHVQMAGQHPNHTGAMISTPLRLHDHHQQLAIRPIVVRHFVPPAPARLRIRPYHMAMAIAVAIAVTALLVTVAAVAMAPPDTLDKSSRSPPRQPNLRRARPPPADPNPARGCSDSFTLPPPCCSPPSHSARRHGVAAPPVLDDPRPLGGLLLPTGWGCGGYWPRPPPLTKCRSRVAADPKASAWWSSEPVRSTGMPHCPP